MKGSLLLREGDVKEMEVEVMEGSQGEGEEWRKKGVSGGKRERGEGIR